MFELRGARTLVPTKHGKLVCPVCGELSEDCECDSEETISAPTGAGAPELPAQKEHNNERKD